MLKKNLGLFLIFFLGSNTFATQKTQDFINQWRKENHISAVSLAIQTAHKKPQYFLSGTTNLHGSTKITEDTLFGVGSITKTFVSATLLQLQEAHQVNLDESIGVYFPEYPRWKNITIRQLLNMTSGIPDFTSINTYKILKQHASSAYHPASFFIQLAYDKKDKFPPGQAWSYSNTNYYLLGLIIEKITGHSLSDEFKQRFFIPLHLNHTFYAEDSYPDIVNSQKAHPYYDSKDVNDRNPSYSGAAGSMLMSTSDLVAWTRDLFTPGKVLSPYSLAQFTTVRMIPAMPPKPNGAAYGLGIYSLMLPGQGTVWWYTGIVDGYSSVFLWVPSKKTIIAAQINGWEDNNFWLLMPKQFFLNAILQKI